MGPTVAHSLRMRLLLLLILPFLNGRSIVRERNDVIKQALIPTLVNIIGHARMVEHGTGDDVDNLLDFMDGRRSWTRSSPGSVGSPTWWSRGTTRPRRRPWFGRGTMWSSRRSYQLLSTSFAMPGWRGMAL